MRVIRPAVLVVARQSLTLLGLVQALLKFGYQLITAYPDETELERAGKARPALVVLRPPLEEEERRTCLQAVKNHFCDRGIPVLVCVSIPVGSKIELAFCVGTAAESLEVVGKVQRHGHGAGAGGGMGIKFESMSSETAGRLESYLMSHLGTMELLAKL